jgi:hypothetical protein
MSLARGPILTIGAILLAFGLLGLLTNSDFPRDQATGGTVNGEHWLGIEVNGWTNFFSIAAGGLLLFAAGIGHAIAKTMAILVGLALAACCVIAVVDGHDVLGLAAANTWTKVAFGAAALASLLAALMPRRERRVVRERDVDHHPVAATAAAPAATAPATPATTTSEPATTVAPAAEPVGEGPATTRTGRFQRRGGLRGRLVRH